MYDNSKENDVSKYSFVCEHCRQDFETNAKNARFCGQKECQQARRRLNRKRTKGVKLNTQEKHIALSRQDKINDILIKKIKENQQLLASLQLRVNALSSIVEEVRAQAKSRQYSYRYDREVGDL